MSDSPLRKAMLEDDEDEDFGEIAQDLEGVINHMRNTYNAIDMVNSDVRAKKATDEMHKEMLININAFERLQGEASKLSVRLKGLAGIEIAKTKKLGRLQDDLDEINKKYDMHQREFMTNVRLSDSVKDSFNDITMVNKSSIVGSGSFMNNSGMPVIQVYSQQDLIAGRDADINRFNQDAKDCRQIASDINSNIYDQDNKLDSIVKVQGDTAIQVKTGNEQLLEARAYAARRQKCIICLTAMTIILLAVLGLSVYVMFYKDRK